MGREKSTERKRIYIRLLIIFGMVFFYSFNAFSNIEMKYFPSDVMVGDIFTLKFVIKQKIFSSPNVLLNDRKEFLSLEKSITYAENESTILENQYKIKKHGILILDEIFLVIDDHKIKQQCIELNVSLPCVSENTEFRLRLFENEDDKSLIEHDINTPFVLGTSYSIIIEGFFKKCKDEKIKVNYLPLNNAIIEKQDITPILHSGNGWSYVAFFRWCPIKSGLQDLPQFEIEVNVEKLKKYNITLRKKKIIVESIKGSKEEKEDEQKIFQNILSKKLEIDEKREKDILERKEIAIKIKELREKEIQAFFYGEIQKKRTELEEKLGFKNTFSPFHYNIYICVIALDCLFLALFTFGCIIRAKKKKRFLNFWNVFLLSSFTFIFLYVIKCFDRHKEFTLIEDYKTFYVYASANEKSTCLSKIEIGETVKIIDSFKEWKFIEQQNHIKGWVKI